MGLHRLTAKDEPAYREFLRNRETARIQHTLGFRDVLDQTYRNAKPWYHITDDCRAIVPLFKMKSHLFGTEIVSQPFLDNGGILGDIRPDDIEDLKAKIGSRQAEIRLNTCMHNYGQLQSVLTEAGFEKHVNRQQFIKELDDPDAMYEGLSDSTTRMVEEAQDNGLEIVDIQGKEEIKQFYPIYRSAMKHFGTPQHPRSYFERLWDRLDDGRIKGMNCVYEGQTIAMMICFTVGNYCYFIYNVSDPDFLDKRPNDFLYWRMMKWAAEQGYEYFDFGQVQADAEDGSHAAGLYHFKEKWGPELYDKPVFTLNKTIEDHDHERAKRWWRKLPSSVTNIVGPFLASRKAY